jgi:hypothetical protein
MVGRAARQRVASASRPSGRAGSIPAPSAKRGRSSMAEPLPPKQKTRVRFSPSVPYRHVRLAAEDTGPSNRVARVRIPHVAPIVLPLRLTGRAPGFDLGGLGSNPRGAATEAIARLQHRGIAQSVERRSHTPRQPQSPPRRRPGFDPCFRDKSCRLSQVGRQRVVDPSRGGSIPPAGTGV